MSSKGRASVFQTDDVGSNPTFRSKFLMVAVAEWLRRQAVDLHTGVQFSPVTPLNQQRQRHDLVERREAGALRMIR